MCVKRYKPNGIYVLTCEYEGASGLTSHSQKSPKVNCIFSECVCVFRWHKNFTI